jgi:thymidylate kinase
MKTAIITGIDGSGKSTLIKRLYQEYSAIPSVKIFACPSYHHIPGSGADELSVIFEKLNRLGNEHHDYDLKALGLYLQMSLYNSVLQRFCELPSVSLIISERHALIDTIVYGGVYAKIIKGVIDQQVWQPIIEKELDKLQPGAFEKVKEWIKYLNKRNPKEYNFWNYTGFFKKIFAEPEEALISRLSDLFDLTLPDQICFLKIKPQTAIQRLKQRSNQLELHENASRLNALQDKYLQLLQNIKDIYPNITITILEKGNYRQMKECIQLTSKSQKSKHNQYLNFL